MDSQELLAHTKELQNRINTYRGREIYDSGYANSAKAQVSEFLRMYAGPQTSFYKEATQVKGADSYMIEQILRGFIEYVETGLNTGISPERRAQLDVVSDFLDQGNLLLDTKGVHPAAPAVLIGATLEEFLRTWVESAGLTLGNKKPSLQSYADVLYSENFITRQDVKDITAWGGVRNHAAHGEWDEVSDKQRIRLMLEGVNLFMRKYGT
jgi:hypothetical protein